jgi:GTPase SAR1 family protein
MFIYGRFTRFYSCTIGAAFYTKKLNIRQTNATIELWDTASQERYGALADMYYKDANIAIVMYDIAEYV